MHDWCLKRTSIANCGLCGMIAEGEREKREFSFLFPFIHLLVCLSGCFFLCSAIEALIRYLVSFALSLSPSLASPHRTQSMFYICTRTPRTICLPARAPLSSIVVVRTSVRRLFPLCLSLPWTRSDAYIKDNVNHSVRTTDISSSCSFSVKDPIRMKWWGLVFFVLAAHDEK